MKSRHGSRKLAMQLLYQVVTRDEELDNFIDSFVEQSDYEQSTKEFGILKDIDQMDFFVCMTSKSGIAFKGDLNKEEISRISNFENLYKNFHELDMNSQGIILEAFFTKDS